jgi:hypothetical protein
MSFSAPTVFRYQRDKLVLALDDIRAAALRRLAMGVLSGRAG